MKEGLEIIQLKLRFRCYKITKEARNYPQVKAHRRKKQEKNIEISRRRKIPATILGVSLAFAATVSMSIVPDSIAQKTGVIPVASAAEINDATISNIAIPNKKNRTTFSSNDSTVIQAHFERSRVSEGDTMKFGLEAPYLFALNGKVDIKDENDKKIGVLSSKGNSSEEATITFTGDALNVKFNIAIPMIRGSLEPDEETQYKRVYFKYGERKIDTGKEFKIFQVQKVISNGAVVYSSANSETGEVFVSPVCIGRQGVNKVHSVTCTYETKSDNVTFDTSIKKDKFFRSIAIDDNPRVASDPKDPKRTLWEKRMDGENAHILEFTANKIVVRVDNVPANHAVRLPLPGKIAPYTNDGENAAFTITINDDGTGESKTMTRHVEAAKLGAGEGSSDGVVRKALVTGFTNDKNPEAPEGKREDDSSSSEPLTVKVKEGEKADVNISFTVKNVGNVSLKDAKITIDGKEVEATIKDLASKKSESANATVPFSAVENKEIPIVVTFADGTKAETSVTVTVIEEKSETNDDMGYKYKDGEVQKGDRYTSESPRNKDNEPLSEDYRYALPDDAPKWISIDEETGVITATPDGDVEIKEYKLEITASSKDENHPEEKIPFVISVKEKGETTTPTSSTITNLVPPPPTKPTTQETTTIPSPPAPTTETTTSESPKPTTSIPTTSVPKPVATETQVPEPAAPGNSLPPAPVVKSKDDFDKKDDKQKEEKTHAELTYIHERKVKDGGGYSFAPGVSGFGVPAAPVYSSGNGIVAGPKVDTGGEIEKGFFQKLISLITG